MSPNSLNEPATPIVTPSLPSLASADTAASLFVQTVPIPSPATVAEWLPWTEGQFELVPKDPAERKKWLATGPLASRKLQPEWRTALEKRYGAQAAGVQHAEAFEITEYGRQPSEEEIRKLLPFLPGR